MSISDVIQQIFKSKPVLYYRKIPLTKEQYTQLEQECRGSPYIVSKEENFVAVIGGEKKSNYILLISTYVKVVKKVVDIDSKEAKIFLEINNGMGIIEEPFSGDIFSKTGVKALLGYGVRYLEKQVDNFLEYLLWSEVLAEVCYSYKSLGWDILDNQLCFKSNSIITNNNLKHCYLYDGSMDLTPKGNFDIWKNMISTEVIGNENLEFILVAGLSSPILSLLNDLKDFGSIIVNLANTSSTGKTTACILVASIYGNPQLNKGCMVSFNATQNALIEQVASVNGISVCIEESAVNQSTDLQKTLYTLSSGTSKSRMAGDGTIKETKSFNSVIFCSSEFNFVDDDSPDGIKVRVFELTGNITSSADNSDKIKSVSLNCYGFAGNILIKFLSELGKEKILEDYELIRKCLLSKYSEAYNKALNEVSYRLNDMELASYNQRFRLNERIIGKLSLFVLTALYVNQVFDFYINIGNIENKIYELINAVINQPTPEEELMNIVIDDVLQNINKYQLDHRFIAKVYGEEYVHCQSDEYIFSNGYVGVIRLTRFENLFELAISQSHFKSLMQHHNIKDYRKRLNNLKKAGLLKAESDRLLSREKINTLVDSSVYKLLFSKENKIDEVVQKHKLYAKKI